MILGTVDSKLSKSCQQSKRTDTKSAKTTFSLKWNSKRNRMAFFIKFIPSSDARRTFIFWLFYSGNQQLLRKNATTRIDAHIEIEVSNQRIFLSLWMNPSARSSCTGAHARVSISRLGLFRYNTVVAVAAVPAQWMITPTTTTTTTT